MRMLTKEMLIQLNKDHQEGEPWAITDIEFTKLIRMALRTFRLRKQVSNLQKKINKLEETL